MWYLNYRDYRHRFSFRLGLISSYRGAILLNPKILEYYRALFYLYKDIFKDKTKAQAILTAGLKSNPCNPDLLRYQSELNAEQ